MERIILHSDLNSFYASVECLYHPEYRDKPLAVAGNPKTHHGIVLTANNIARRSGVKTGLPVWQAMQICPDLVCTAPNFSKYMHFSRLAQNIYADYTDRIEPFGIDEFWLDVTESTNLFGSGKEIAEEIRRRIREELGITVSIGVSFNKIFAKLGSDYKKPDAVTVISPQNFHRIVWPLPVQDLLFVGQATARKLSALGVRTIGDLACCDPFLLERQLGKCGPMLHRFANGLDHSPVRDPEHAPPMKSIGNSVTTLQTLEDSEAVRITLLMLSEKVAARLRKYKLRGKVIHVSVRSTTLESFIFQKKLECATCLSSEIADTALTLFTEKYHWKQPVRAIGICLSDLCGSNQPIQIDLFQGWKQSERLEQLETSVDFLRQRFGSNVLQRASLLDTGIVNTESFIGFQKGGIFS